MPLFQTNDVNLFYSTHGSGQPVLLIHGWACDGNDWSFQIPHLLSLGFSVIALDQRGHGRSSAPADINSYTLATFAKDAMSLLQHLDISSVILMGHSMGSVIASYLAAKYPDIVKALVLVHPIYAGAPPTLRGMGDEMIAHPDRVYALSEGFWMNYMYTPRTPEWLKVWQVRRLNGCDPTALAGCLVGLAKDFGTVMGQTEETKAFMRKRKGPRLAVCTLPDAPAWEYEIGVEEGVDEVHELTEGTFSHMVQNDKFNDILERWLRKRDLAVL
ncbi:Alpha/Beta hydrolase protein [Lophiotrema nucula]|uniref:Alpha/Beta hydrolase protein n=1 Tax=Lophiotrema nucula TaxID=690887 RepID=A0A6A5Z249_9PLEO|nr:Alpha/Beta hydrolase protein [Lophiotrema nucula]